MMFIKMSYGWRCEVIDTVLIKEDTKFLYTVRTHIHRYKIHIY